MGQGNVIPGDHPHSICCYHKHGVPVPEDRKAELPSVGGDFSLEMENFVKNLALENTCKDAKEIWKETVKHFRELGGGNFQGLSKMQVTSLVYNTRRDNIGGDAIRKVEAEYSGSKKSAFLRHSCTFSDEKGPQRMMCFGVPELFSHLCYPMVSPSA